MGLLRVSTKGYLDTPISNGPVGNNSQDLEIEVIDPTHPLFGRKFEVLYLLKSLYNTGFVLVRYTDSIFLRIPILTTTLASTRPLPSTAKTKLNLAAIKELVRVAEECEVLACPPSVGPPNSGSNYPQPTNSKLELNSKPSLRR
jgi:hypothetical protein